LYVLQCDTKGKATCLTWFDVAQEAEGFEIGPISFSKWGPYIAISTLLGLCGGSSTVGPATWALVHILKKDTTPCNLAEAHRSFGEGISQASDKQISGCCRMLNVASLA
jgi:hypothetical protein